MTNEKRGETRLCTCRCSIVNSISSTIDQNALSNINDRVMSLLIHMKDINRLVERIRPAGIPCLPTKIEASLHNCETGESIQRCSNDEQHPGLEDRQSSLFDHTVPRSLSVAWKNQLFHYDQIEFVSTCVNRSNAHGQRSVQRSLWHKNNSMRTGTTSEFDVFLSFDQFNEERDRNKQKHSIFSGSIWFGNKTTDDLDISCRSRLPVCFITIILLSFFQWNERRIDIEKESNVFTKLVFHRRQTVEWESVDRWSIAVSDKHGLRLQLYSY